MGVDDALWQVLWTLYFVEGQGYEVKKNELNQDYISSMKLEKVEKDKFKKNKPHKN